MAAKNENASSIKIVPLTKERWPDFEKLFGKNGACGGCWCMYWRLTRSEFETRKGEGNRRAMKTLVQKGKIPGLLVFHDNQAVAWCALAPRGHYSALERSRILKPVDDQPVWSISCFFVAKNHRKQGLTVKLLCAAVEYVKKQGGKIVEGYPVEPRKGRLPDTFVWTGLSSAYKQAGFVECARRSETRPLMRFFI